MNRQHGKPVDPRRFKQQDLEDLWSAISSNRERAAVFESRDHHSIEGCPICDTSQRTTVRTMFGYEYVQCSGCTHVYLSRQPTEESLIAYFESNEEISSLYTDERQQQYRREHITEPKFDFALEHIDYSTGRWLDAGCGMGLSVDYLRELGWEAVGIEPSGACVDAAIESLGIELVRQTLGEYADHYTGTPFDVVSMFGLLLFVQDPIRELERARNLLAGDGYVVIGDVHYDSVSSRVHRAFPDRAARHSIPPIGLHQFTESSLNQMLEVTGFEPIAMWYFGLDFYEFLSQLQLEFDGFAESALYDHFMNHLNQYQQVIDTDERSDYFIAVCRCT